MLKNVKTMNTLKESFGCKDFEVLEFLSKELEKIRVKYIDDETDEAEVVNLVLDFLDEFSVELKGGY